MSDVNAAIEFVMGPNEEGGYTPGLPGDPGGETNFGISKRAYPLLDIKNLTREQAKAIYKRDWMDKYNLGQIVNQEILNHVFSLLINMGPFHDFTIVQRAVNNCGIRIQVDGRPGPETFAAINRCAAVQLLRDEISIEAIRYYISLKKPQFLAGWINRVLN
jgi:lysozyme family protein